MGQISLAKDTPIEAAYLKAGGPLAGGIIDERAKAVTFADCIAHLILPTHIYGDPESPMIEVKGLTLLSWSKHRDGYPVTGLGKSRFKGITPGHRTVAGTIGFNVFGESPFSEALRRYQQSIGYLGGTATMDVDELPPFELSLVFLTPNGDFSRVLIRGVSIIDESSNLSVRDTQLTEVFSFIAVSATNLHAGPTFRDLTLLEGTSTPPVTKQKDWAGVKTAPTTSSTTSSSTTATTGTTTTPSTTTSTTTPISTPASHSTTTTSTTTSSTTTSATTMTTTATPITVTSTSPGGPGPEEI